MEPAQDRERETLIAGTMKSTMIVQIALAVGTMVTVITMAFVRFGGVIAQPNVDQTLLYILSGVMVVFVVQFFFARMIIQKQFKKSARTQALQASGPSTAVNPSSQNSKLLEMPAFRKLVESYTGFKIVESALLESIGMLAAVSFMLTGQLYFVIAAILSIISIILILPSRQQLDAWCEAIANETY